MKPKQSAFSQFSVPFRPYDLRHCWAIRNLEFVLDVWLAAQKMGHSIQVHTDRYRLQILKAALSTDI